jgi:RNA polymerase subunit RPABC4/transcription elongation factor Spt4
MRYCRNCRKFTAGKPAYCNFCGRSYSVKLCPRGHRNPRSADACAECGSRELRASPSSNRR